MVRIALSLGILALAGVLQAQDLEPRAYSNSPGGLNFLVGGYAYSTGGVSTDPSLPIEDAELQLNTLVAAYARALDVFGKSGKFDIILPFSDLSGSALVAGQRVERNVTGFADPRFRFSVNFYGAPALSLKDFASYKQNTIVGASFQLSAPAGQYDNNKVVNLGTNRWSFKPEIGVSKAFGKFILELTTGVIFYTENDDFFGGKTREQDPIYAAQAHLCYTISRGMWAAVDATYYRGGRTTVNGALNNDELESSRIGATFALPVNKYNSIKLYVSTGLSSQRGSDFTIGGIAWQYRWGAGL